MIVVRDFQPGDLAELVPQAAQAGPVDTSAAFGAQLAAQGPAFSARDGDGRLVLTAGFATIMPGYARCWCRLAAVDGFTLAALTRSTRRVILMMLADHRRIDMEVLSSFEQGHRWARMLGFTREGTMRSYGPEGQDFDLYARTQG